MPLLERVPLLRERLLARALDEKQRLSLKAARSRRNLDP